MSAPERAARAVSASDGKNMFPKADRTAVTAVRAGMSLFKRRKGGAHYINSAIKDISKRPTGLPAGETKRPVKTGKTLLLRFRREPSFAMLRPENGSKILQSRTRLL